MTRRIHCYIHAVAFLALSTRYAAAFSPAGLPSPHAIITRPHAKLSVRTGAGQVSTVQQWSTATAATTASTTDATPPSDPNEAVQRSLLQTRLELERKAKQSSMFRHMWDIVSASLIGAKYAIRQSWWTFPFLITVYPLLYFLVEGKPATSPAFWSMPVLSSLIHSPSAGVVIGGFLLSNISYFLSGLYLLDVIPDVRWAIPSKRKLMEKRELGPGFSENPLLGTMVILCGIMSVLYHTFQTLGPHHVAETFYYIDHGFAISSILYFLNLCGVPGKKTLAIGTAGLVMLATGSIRGAEAYAWIHSLWHFFSAGASVSWAHDGLKKSENESQ